ncbi:hypothetical protein K438DRAFT_1946547 [Mycena galopus ATCC 62051]|nr:hypothetical protein K438DRAFT_1946547 [Mycena galopus ATCC 62051]
MTRFGPPGDQAVCILGFPPDPTDACVRSQVFMDSDWFANILQHPARADEVWHGDLGRLKIISIFGIQTLSRVRAPSGERLPERYMWFPAHQAVEQQSSRAAASEIGELVIGMKVRSIFSPGFLDDFTWDLTRKLPPGSSCPGAWCTINFQALTTCSWAQSTTANVPYHYGEFPANRDGLEKLRGLLASIFVYMMELSTMFVDHGPLDRGLNNYYAAAVAG